MLLLAVGCSRGTKPVTTASTTAQPITTAAQTTTTATPTTTPAAATDDTSVAARLRDAATAELTLYTDKLSFSDNPKTLAEIEPGIQWASGVTPPTNPVVVNVAISGDAQWACLTGKSAAGHVFVTVTGPRIDVYSGTTAVKSCSAAVILGMRRTNG